ncbi:hypothetical protein DF185_19805 [Marinifilum breve]|uniref:Uncharacterized protein n=1 Tax=Marinifilum breve TaxID=2184082 RepID=A0A2V3ZT75_9BACT|nr:hypothetical protein [Marinifilum breve]PXX96887.1 hypothetical protein DF185_19805 [Marinifilum breve]
MEKATIIVSSRIHTGEKEVAKLLENYEHPCRMEIYSNKCLEIRTFLFGSVNEETDVIVIYLWDRDPMHNYTFWFPFINGNILVNSKGKAPFIRKTPKLIFITDRKPDHFYEKYFNQYYEVITANQ